MKDTPRQDPDRQLLFDIASEQHGYFTTAQAVQCGYARSTLGYHVSRGTFQRVSHGVYRFRDYPSSPFEHVVAAWLAVGKDIAVVSHASALELWDLSDVVPEETFTARGTHALPAELPPPPAEWSKPYAVLAEQVGFALELDDGYRRARAFLDPVLGGNSGQHDRWSAGGQRWDRP